MHKIFEAIIEIFNWFWIMLSPTLIVGGIGYLLSEKYNQTLWLYALGGTGLLSGIVLAEFIRRKYGCANFIAKLYS